MGRYGNLQSLCMRRLLANVTEALRVAHWHLTQDVQSIITAL